jgi:hypothetical protein
MAADGGGRCKDRAIRNVLNFCFWHGSRWWGWCNDQAMHNVLLWTGQLETRMNVTLFPAGTNQKENKRVSGLGFRV